MDACTLNIFLGVILGAALTAGLQPRAFLRTLGDERLDKLLRLLDLLEEPEEEEERPPRIGPRKGTRRP